MLPEKSDAHIKKNKHHIVCNMLYKNQLKWILELNINGIAIRYSEKKIYKDDLIFMAKGLGLGLAKCF